jgi:hypothetical protein
MPCCGATIRDKLASINFSNENKNFTALSAIEIILDKIDNDMQLIDFEKWVLKMVAIEYNREVGENFLTVIQTDNELIYIESINFRPSWIARLCKIFSGKSEKSPNSSLSVIINETTGDCDTSEEKMAYETSYKTFTGSKK